MQEYIKEMFQFLLGRLETDGYDVYGLTLPGFQFLLGRLETELRSWGMKIKGGFNSS